MGSSTCKDDTYERQREDIKDFIKNDGPKRATFSFVEFNRAFRNKAVVYDVEVPTLGVVGYLYAPSSGYGEWEYDIVMRPPLSGRARRFATAQASIAKHLCNILPMQSTTWVRLPQSVKTCIMLLRDTI